MAIDYNSGISSLDAGASDITYTGDRGPKSPDQERQMAFDDTPGFELRSLDELLDEFRMDNNGRDPTSIDDLRRHFYIKYGPQGIAKVDKSVQQSKKMDSADPVLQDEYDKYVFDLQENNPGATPMSIEEFRQQAISGMAEGGIARLGYRGGQLVKNNSDGSRPGYWGMSPGEAGARGLGAEAHGSGDASGGAGEGQGRQDPEGGYTPEHKYSKTAAEMRTLPGSEAAYRGTGDAVTADQLRNIIKQEEELRTPPKGEKPKFMPSIIYNLAKPFLKKGDIKNRSFFVDKVLGSKNFNYTDIRDILGDEDTLEDIYQKYMLQLLH